jgi:hypothetical protein
MSRYETLPEWYSEEQLHADELEEETRRAISKATPTPAQVAWRVAHPEYVEGTPEHTAAKLEAARKLAEYATQARDRHEAHAAAADAGRETLDAELILAHAPDLYQAILALPEYAQNQFVLLTHKLDAVGPSALTLAEKERLAKYIANRLTAAPIYAKEFAVPVICKCGHTEALTVSKSDVRHKLWTRMISASVRVRCASCCAPIREAEQDLAALIDSYCVDCRGYLLSGEAATLREATELATGDHEQQRQIYRRYNSWRMEHRLSAR